MRQKKWGNDEARMGPKLPHCPKLPHVTGTSSWLHRTRSSSWVSLMSAILNALLSTTSFVQTKEVENGQWSHTYTFSFEYEQVQWEHLKMSVSDTWWWLTGYGFEPTLSQNFVSVTDARNVRFRLMADLLTLIYIFTQWKTKHSLLLLISTSEETLNQRLFWKQNFNHRGSSVKHTLSYFVSSHSFIWQLAHWFANKLANNGVLFDRNVILKKKTWKQLK